MKKRITALSILALITVLPVAGVSAERGTFTDSRDNRTYQTVRVGNAVWMAENLNFETAGGSWCYANNTSNCDKYGRLYTWDVAKEACPAGWRLPDTADWERLERTVSGRDVSAQTSRLERLLSDDDTGTKLKSKTGWGGRSASPNGTDDIGFSALPGGARRSNGKFYGGGSGKNATGYWWTSSMRSPTSIFYRAMIGDLTNVSNFGNGKAGSGMSVRCVQ